MNLDINMDDLLKSQKEELRKKFISEAKREANRQIEKYFEPPKTETVHWSSGRPSQHLIPAGPGYQQIDTFITEKFCDDAGMKAYMEKFFIENYERIMDSCLEKAMTHHCNKLAFAAVQEKAKDGKSFSFNPADGSPETALQMAAVIHERDKPTPPPIQYSSTTNP